MTRLLLVKTIDVDREYAKDKDLKKRDVEYILEWLEKQPHLPKLTELHVILFLQSCYFSIEQAKRTIDIFFTLRTHCPEIFSATREDITRLIKVSVVTTLPKKTPKGERVIFARLIDFNVNHFVDCEQILNAGLMATMMLMKDGTDQGHVIIVDLAGMAVAHMLKMRPHIVKQFFLFFQDAIPLRLKAIHVVNVVPFIDLLMRLVKPFLRGEILQMLQFHSNSLDALFEQVPQECLPSDFGGTADSITTLHESAMNTVLENFDFLEKEMALKVDESKRIGKPPVNIDQGFGLEGSFRKLEVD